MLNKLRKKKTAKKIWIVLCILILPAFVLWGTGSIVRSKQEAKYTGKIFGKDVTFLEYKEAFEAVKNQAMMQFGDNFSELQKYLDLESQAWGRLILLAEAKRRKINSSDSEVIQQLTGYPLFQDKKGKFDQQRYEQTLRYVFRTQPRAFEEQTRQNLAIAKLYRGLTDNLSLTEDEIKEAYRKLNEQVSLEYIAALPANFAKDISVSDEEAKNYFAKNALQFKQPLSFNIEYVSLPADEQEENSVKEKLKGLMLRLNKKDDFKQAAQSFGLEVKESGLFTQTDPIPGIGWSPEILGLIYSAKTGDYLAPIRLDKFYYIIKLKEKKEPYIPDFETAKDKVRDRLIKEKSSEIAKQKIEECLKKLKADYLINPRSVDLGQTAKTLGLKSSSTALLKYGSYIEGVGVADTLLNHSQGLKEDSFSEIIKMPAGFYIIKLKEKIPLDEKKFSQEKAAFTQQLLTQKKQEYFANFLEELKKRAANLP